MNEARTCAKCGESSVGAVGVLCPGYLELLTQQAHDYWRNHPPTRSTDAPDQHHYG
jgi:hypothetical protein